MRPTGFLVEAALFVNIGFIMPKLANQILTIGFIPCFVLLANRSVVGILYNNGLRHSKTSYTFLNPYLHRSRPIPLILLLIQLSITYYNLCIYNRISDAGGSVEIKELGRPQQCMLDTNVSNIIQYYINSPIFLKFIFFIHLIYNLTTYA
jgi:hypothetical protein